MPDPIEDKKEPDKQAPAMQEGAPRDIAAISADIANADPTDTAKLAALAIEYRQALVAKATEAMAGNGPASTPEPPMAPPTMGMKPEDAYARARTEWAKERTEAIEAIIEANPHLDDKQKAMARKQSTVAAARELIATYPRVANQNEPACMGMDKNPKLGAPAARAVEGGLPPEESAAMARSMGAKENKPQPPHVNARGRFSMGNMTPTQLREAIAKGNDPRNLFPSTLGA